MGLSMVHGIVRNHGGTITVYSEPGKGSEFHIFLPSVAKSGEEMPIAALPLPKGKECIMFLDDERFQVDIATQYLGRLGYQMVPMARSTEALEHFLANPQQFDMVITDMTMPEMTGDVLSRKLLAVRPDLPIIICTGYSERISVHTAEAIGIRRFVLKPIVMRDLALMIREVFDGGGRRQG